MKKIFFIAIAILLGSAATAQQSDAIYKLLREEWTVNADGSSDYHHRHEVQILRNRALVAYAGLGETFVVYNPDIEELTVNEVYTIQKDGTLVAMPQNAFVYQLPSECADCGRFNHIRELAMVHTGMELGCSIVVDYTIHSRNGIVNRTINLVQDYPVETLEVNVMVPEGQQLNVQLNNPEVFDFNPTMEQSATSYSLKARDLSQRYSDRYMPAPEQLYPTLHFFNGTPQFAVAESDEPFEEAMDAIGKVTGKVSDKEQVTNIRNYVVDNIHLNDLEPATVGYAVASPSETWQSGCGTAADKAALLAAILRNEEYEANVCGENMDMVSVVIDTLEYRLTIRDKAPIQLYGEAHDEVSIYSNDLTEEAVLDTVEEGFYRLNLPLIPGAPALDIRRMAITRTAPLQSSACDLSETATYILPKGVKMMGTKVNEKLTFDGVGSVQVSIKQSGKKLIVVRKLKLEKSIVPVSDYENYRKLLAVWQSHDSVMLRSK